jgi:hypothetical protein
MKVFVVIPYFSDGIELNQNEVSVFTTRQEAEQFIRVNQFSYFEIVETLFDIS